MRGEAFTVTAVKKKKKLVKASTITHLVLEWLNATFWVCAGDLGLDLMLVFHRVFLIYWTNVMLAFKEHLFSTHHVCFMHAASSLLHFWFSGPCISMFRYIFQVSDSPLQSLWFGHRWPLAVNGSGGLSTRCPGFLELWDNDAFLLLDAECVAERWTCFNLVSPRTWWHWSSCFSIYCILQCICLSWKDLIWTVL